MFTFSFELFYVIYDIYQRFINFLFDYSALRGRVYLPQDELGEFGLSDKDVFSRKVSERWKEFMKQQIARARFYFNSAEEGASHLDKASRWPVCIFYSIDQS